MHTHKAQSREADCCCHVTHLAIFSLDKRELYPACGNVLAESYWGISLPEIWGGDDFRFAGLGVVALDNDAFGELLYSFFGNLSVNLCEVGTRMPEFRVQQLLDELSVVCKKQRPFAIVVEATGGVNARWKVKFVKSLVTGLLCKLTQDTERLVKKDDCRHLKRCLRY